MLQYTTLYYFFMTRHCLTIFITKMKIQFGHFIENDTIEIQNDTIELYLAR